MADGALAPMALVLIALSRKTRGERLAGRPYKVPASHTAAPRGKSMPPTDANRILVPFLLWEIRS